MILWLHFVLTSAYGFQQSVFQVAHVCRLIISYSIRALSSASRQTSQLDFTVIPTFHLSSLHLGPPHSDKPYSDWTFVSKSCHFSNICSISAHSWHSKPWNLNRMCCWWCSFCLYLFSLYPLAATEAYIFFLTVYHSFWKDNFVLVIFISWWASVYYPKGMLDEKMPSQDRNADSCLNKH